jgi:hypothetical protein
VSERSEVQRNDRIDWDATVKLAVVVSLVAALMVVALAGHVASPVLIGAILTFGSALSWRRAGRRVHAG